VFSPTDFPLFSGSCTCSKFQPFAKSCFESSCAPSHLQQGLDAISVTCANYTTITTSTQPSSTTTLLTNSRTSSQSSIISDAKFTGTTTHTTTGYSTSWTGVTSDPVPTTWTTTTSDPAQNTALPPGWPSSIIGPACVPIHGEPNSSYPLHNNWTNGIVWVNGTGWMNSSCISNVSASKGVEQVSVNGGARIWVSMISLGLCGFIAFVFL
jgi:hypothetical protein